MSGNVGVPCGVCNRRCIPLADYDLPVCVACDTANEAVTSRLYLSEEIVRRMARKAVPDLERPMHTYYGAAAPDVLEELLDALVPRPGRNRHRTAHKPLPGAAA